MFSIELLFKSYLLHIQKYKSKGTYHSYHKDFVSLSKAFRAIDQSNFVEVSPLLFEDLIDYYTCHTEKKNSKINDVLSSLITVFNYHQIKYPKRYKLPDDTEHYRALNQDEYNLLRNYLNSFDLSIGNNLALVLSVYLFLDTGIRLSEIMDLKFSNVDFVEHTILLEHTKNKKRRYAFFGSLSEELLRVAKAKKSEYVLHNYVIIKKMHFSTLYRFFDQINHDIILRSGRIHPHCLRKTFATRLLKKGLSLPIISKLLGHSDVRQTMIYLQIDMEMMKEGYFAFYPNEYD